MAQSNTPPVNTPVLSKPTGDPECIFVTGKFQLPFHKEHEKLLRLAIQRAEALHVPLYVFLGHSDEKTQKLYGNVGMSLEARKKFLNTMFGIPMDHMLDQVEALHGGPEQVFVWAKKFCTLLAEKGIEPGKSEMVLTIKESDKKDYLDDGILRHYADLLQDYAGIPYKDLSSLFTELESLSSTILRRDPAKAAECMPPLAYLIKELREHGFEHEPFMAPVHKATASHVDPEYLKYNVGTVISYLENLPDKAAKIDLPESIDLGMEPDSFANMIQQARNQASAERHI